ncbi:MAG: helix-turn-helix domain-containing protein [Microthrixaceae bacterium]|jgi:hypothetical protein|nr:helix-turn-helix domain-containing protein [Microthrixaceae bacterium]
MSTVMTLEVPFDREIPDVVDVPWCAEVFGLTRTAVQRAIREQRLPARKFGNVWMINPEHAARLWGHRLMTAATDA